MSPSRANSSRAFTIVEVMVATAILALMVVLLAGMVSQVARLWQRGTAQTDQRRNARTILDFISTDLRGAILPVDPLPPANDPRNPTSNSGPPPNLHFLLNPSTVPPSHRHADALFWQAPIATDASRGDAAHIGYFVKWDTSTNPANPRARLCRFFVNPVDEKNYRIYSHPGGDLSAERLDAVAPAHNQSDGTMRAGWRGLLAEDVVGFWARWRNGDDWVVSFDSRTTPTLPRTVQISVVQLDPIGAQAVTPAVQAALAELSRSTEHAHEFIERLASDPALRFLLPNTRASSTAVRLENAP
jgi:type II secretory pathway pseudopilin PulG